MVDDGFGVYCVVICVTGSWCVLAGLVGVVIIEVLALICCEDVLEPLAGEVGFVVVCL
jgi:hypothetical protein